jgi:hypothetical protein
MSLRQSKISTKDRRNCLLKPRDNLVVELFLKPHHNSDEDKKHQDKTKVVKLRFEEIAHFLTPPQTPGVVGASAANVASEAASEVCDDCNDDTTESSVAWSTICVPPAFSEATNVATAVAAAAREFAELDNEVATATRSA